MPVSHPVLLEALTPALAPVGTGGGSACGLLAGNLPDDAAELLRRSGGGEPHRCCLKELRARPGLKDAAVLGSAGLGADGRNRTQVRGDCPTSVHGPVLLGQPGVLLCVHLGRWGDRRLWALDGTGQEGNVSRGAMKT